MSVLLDSDVVVDFLRGLPAAGRYIDGLAVTPTCSELTRVEVVRGMRSHERRVTERFLATIRWVGVDEEIGALAGDLGRRFRRTHGALGVADLVIAATAQRLRFPLATPNIRHFPMFPGLEPAYRR
jgi:predicted nucleic acid-binding protein